MLFRCHDGYVKKGLMEIENIKETETSTYLFLQNHILAGL